VRVVVPDVTVDCCVVVVGTVVDDVDVLAKLVKVVVRVVLAVSVTLAAGATVVVVVGVAVVVVVVGTVDVVAPVVPVTVVVGTSEVKVVVGVGQTACAVSVPDPPTVAVVLILVEEATETPPELVQEENDAPGFGLKVMA
jgi:hypothetical protein